MSVIVGLLVVNLWTDRIVNSRQFKSQAAIQQQQYNLETSIDNLRSLIQDAYIINAESRDAAVGTLQELRTALQQAAANAGNIDPRIKQALEAIHRIEEYLCGTTCD